MGTEKNFVRLCLRDSDFPRVRRDATLEVGKEQHAIPTVARRQEHLNGSHHGQYFLLKQDITQVGSIDADFGINTERATSIFQFKMGLPNTGKLDRPTLDVAETLGYKVQPNNYYQSKPVDFPSRPTSLSSPANASRNRDFTCFKFMQLPRNRRPDDESIVQKGSCDGREPDWAAAHIVTIPIPQLDFAKGYDGRFRCHKKAAPIFAALFAKWEAENLLHLIRSYEGCFVARYIRGNSPGPDGHGLKNSSDVGVLSNHSFGSTFDINFVDNQRQHACSLW